VERQKESAHWCPRRWHSHEKIRSDPVKLLVSIRLRRGRIFHEDSTRGIGFSYSVDSDHHRPGSNPEVRASVANDSKSLGVTWSLFGNLVHGRCLRDVDRQHDFRGRYNAPATVSTKMTVTIVATSVADTTKSNPRPVVVTPAPSITTTSLANGTVRTAYSPVWRRPAGPERSPGACQRLLAARGPLAQQCRSDFRHAHGLRQDTLSPSR